MKKRVYLAIFALTFGLCAGCGNKEADSDISGTEDTVFQTEEPLELSGTGNIDLSEENKDSGGKNADSSEENNGSGEEDTDIESTDTQEIDFTRDYSEDIKKDVDDVVSASASLQEELENIHTLSEQYEAIAQTAQTQGEMNMSSGWFLKIWDTELNNLWSRFSDSADAQTKEKVLAEQRSWNSMKEEVAQESLGSSEENGSMYSLLVNFFLEEITKNRAYGLANELAKVKGEAFEMPERSTKYGVFVDNQGTGSVYSLLCTQQGVNGSDEAVISIYRQGELKGSFVDNGNGELEFSSEDGSVKGIIQINGWDGASFEVTETSNPDTFPVGQKTEFPFAF